MLKALLLSFTLALAAMAMAQINLVPNGSFEDTVNCQVNTQSTLLKATHWYNPNAATPDVWDCDSTRWCGMPMGPSNNSYQYSYDGDRHAGIYCWYGPGSSNTREYLGVRLSEPMIPGQSYEVSIRYARRRVFGYAIDHLGVWFGWDSLWQNTTAWLSVEPLLRLHDPDSEYLDEADEWTLIKDTMVANGGEEWMVIGHFEPAATVDGILYDPNGITLCYYFVDDVVVTPLEIHSGISAPPAHWSSDGRVLHGDAGTMVQVRIHDLSGRLLHAQHAYGGDRISLTDLPTGTYVVEIMGDNSRAAIKVMKE